MVGNYHRTTGTGRRRQTAITAQVMKAQYFAKAPKRRRRTFGAPFAEFGCGYAAIGHSHLDWNTKANFAVCCG
jgi:hypothetical protein